MPPHATKAAFFPRAGILAWFWPGWGHIVLGERRRGFGVMAGMLLLILTGLLVGGVDAVDRRQDRLWFYAQVGCGPLILAADYVNHHFLHQNRPSDLEVDLRDDPPDWLTTTSFGRPNEMGTLFIALAGLMNLVVILDALFYRPRFQLSPGRDPQRRYDDA